ncbi:MAG: hypothetical protein ACRD3V_04850 [Vicinamibacteria bacterium]
MKVESEILAKRDVGTVQRCPEGCVHIHLPHFGFRLSERQYWELMELLSEASVALRSRGGKAN